MRKLADDYRRHENNRCDNAGNKQGDDGERRREAVPNRSILVARGSSGWARTIPATNGSSTSRNSTITAMSAASIAIQKVTGRVTVIIGRLQQRWLVQSVASAGYQSNRSRRVPSAKSNAQCDISAGAVIARRILRRAAEHEFAQPPVATRLPHASVMLTLY